MKFLKYSVFVLFGFAVISAILSFGSAQTGKVEQVEEHIVELESAVNNGQIISDGIIMSEENPNAKPNAIGEGATIVSETIIGGCASFLKMVGDFIVSIF